jgi:hypothetical protein
MTGMYFTAVSTLTCPITVGKRREQNLFPQIDRQRDCMFVQLCVASRKWDSINYLWN